MVRGAAGASLLLLTGVLSVAVAAPLDKKNGGERSAEPSAKEAVKENPDCFDELGECAHQPRDGRPGGTGY